MEGRCTCTPNNPITEKKGLDRDRPAHAPFRPSEAIYLNINVPSPTETAAAAAALIT